MNVKIGGSIIMGKLSLIKRMKEFVGNVAWKIFLWASEMTEDEYILMIQRSCRL